MASTDFPFSITSKFIDQGGAEHLVTVRAPTVEAFAARLQEAATLFPYAGFTNGNASPEHPSTHPDDQPTPITRARGVNQGPPNANAPKCSVHNRPMRPSNRGGWYCPAKNGDGTYCQIHAA